MQHIFLKPEDFMPEDGLQLFQLKKRGDMGHETDAIIWKRIGSFSELQGKDGEIS